jgi:hypothetical protein
MQEKYLSSLQAFWEFSAALDKDHIQLEHQPCTGPLKKVFDREVILPNLFVKLATPDRELLTSVNRYQSRGPGNEEVRLFFDNLRSGGPMRVGLTLNPRRFEISVTIDGTREPIPSCDYGELGMELPEGAVLVDKKDLLETVKKRNRRVKAITFSMLDVRPTREFPIYSRPVYNPPPVQVPRGEIEAEAVPDWSIREVRAFSQRGLLPVMNELDPAHDYLTRGDGSRSRPIILMPKLKPAIEIAELIIDNLCP